MIRSPLPGIFSSWFGALRGQLRAGAWLMGGTAASGLFAYAAVTLSARLLGTAEFGLLGALVGLASLAATALRPLNLIATHVGAASAAGRGPAMRDLGGPVLALSVGGGFVALVVVNLARGPLGAFFQTDDARPILLLPAVLAALTCVQLANGFVAGLQRFPALALALVVDAAVRALVIAPLVLRFGVAGAVAAYMLGYTAASAMSLGVAGALGFGWRLPPEQELVGHLRIGTSSISLTLMLALLQNGDTVILRSYAPADEVGLYAAAASLGNLLVTLAAPLYVPAFPRTVAARRARAPTTPILVATLLPTLALGLACTLGAVWLSGPVAGLVFGRAFEAAGGLIPVYLAKTTGLLVLAVIGQHALALGRGQSLLVGATLAIVGLAALAGLRPAAPSAALMMLASASVTAAVVVLLQRARDPLA